MKEQQSKKVVNKILLIILAILALVVVAAVVYNYFMPKNEVLMATNTPDWCGGRDAFKTCKSYGVAEGSYFLSVPTGTIPPCRFLCADNPDYTVIDDTIFEAMIQCREQEEKCARKVANALVNMRCNPPCRPYFEATSCHIIYQGYAGSHPNALNYLRYEAKNGRGCVCNFMVETEDGTNYGCSYR